MNERGKTASLGLIASALLLLLLAACQVLSAEDIGDAGTAEQIQALEIEDVVVHDNLSQNVGFDTVLESMRGTRGMGLVREEDRDLPRLERPQNREFLLGAYAPTSTKNCR
jgi:hypothetical protein